MAVKSAYGSQAIVVATTTAQIADSISKTVFMTAASIFQYLLPVLCLVGAALSAWKRSKRKSLVQGITASEPAASLDVMTWKEFELLVGEAFRQKGYKVTELGGAGPDGGVDLLLAKGGETTLVQCKQWKAFKGRRRSSARTLRPYGRQGGRKRHCRDLWRVHQRCTGVCARAQRQVAGGRGSFCHVAIGEVRD